MSFGYNCIGNKKLKKKNLLSLKSLEKNLPKKLIKFFLASPKS
jgi:hypothetical protein